MVDGSAEGVRALVRCPKCRGLMEQREAVGHYGAKFALFQCPECSGIWVDSQLVAAITRDSAIEAEARVEFEEISTDPREVEAFCPRCAINLTEQTGSGMPRGLHIDYCTGCYGYWFDKGELMIYKTYLEERRQKFRQGEVDKRERKKRLKRAQRALEAEPMPLTGYDSGMGVARGLIRLLRFLG